MQIDFAAEPGVGGGVGHLGVGEIFSCPVGDLLPLGDAEAEEDGGEAAQS